MVDNFLFTRPEIPQVYDSINYNDSHLYFHGYNNYGEGLYVYRLLDYHCPSGTLPGKAPRLFTHSLYDTDWYVQAGLFGPDLDQS